MINHLRNKATQRALLIVVCILIIPGFVFVGISSNSTGLGGSVGTLAGKKIKTQEFIRNFEAMRRELEVFGGADLSRLGDTVDLEQLAWQRILLVRAAKDAGVRVEDKDVIDWIQKQPVFQEEGAFSDERYRLLLDRYLKVSAKTFEDETREYLSLQRYRDQIRGDYQPQDAELQERFKLVYGPRQLEYVLFTKDDTAPVSPATDEELQAMYARFSGRLFTQEAVQVRYLAVDASQALTADDEAAQWESKSVRTPYVAREEAIPGIGAAPALSEAMFGLSTAGQKTDWIEHDGKKYRFELIERRAQTPMTFDDAKKVLEEMVSQEKAFRAVIEKASAFHKAMESSDWDKAIASEKLQTHTMAAYLPGDYVEKVGKLTSVGRMLSELKAGEVSGPVQTSNGLAIFKVVSQSEPDEKLFADKREQLEKELRLKHEMTVFGKALQALQSTLQVNTEVLAKLFPSKYNAPSA